MTKSINITYVPADCGSMLPGKSKAPDAFKQIGIAQKLLDSGFSNVEEVDALSAPAKFKVVEKSSNGVRNEEANLEVCQDVHASLIASLDKNADFQLILGGECCMSPAIVSAFWDSELAKNPKARIGLIYVDADTDLYSPSDPDSIGTFAGMNMTHMLRAPGGLKEMEKYSGPGKTALCNSSNLVFFGTNMNPSVNKPEHLGYLFDNGYRVLSANSVSNDPTGSAQKALAYLESQVDVILVHLDVDSIDPQLFPLSNVPNFTGVTFEQMMNALSVLLKSEKVKALTVAEVNPDHDPDLTLTTQLTDELVRMLSGI